MADFGLFQTGAAGYPLTSSTTNSLLRDADPALFYVLDYFQSVLTTYVQPRLLAEVARTPVIANIAGVVAQFLPLDPAPFLQEQQVRFPLLAVYRVKEKYTGKSVTWNDDVSMWKVAYVLPPLTGAQRERILPTLRAVAKTLQNRIENMFDPSYASGVSPWALANIEAIQLMEGEYGDWQGAGNLSFPSWIGTLEVKERDIEAATQWANSFTGVDAEIDLTTANQPPALDLSDVKSDFVDPTTLATLASFHRADAGISAGTDASKVGGWADQSVGAVSLSPGGPSSQPFLIKNALTLPNGTTKPAVRFDGLATYLSGTVTALANDAGKTYVVLFRLWDTALRSSILLHTANTANTTLSLEANTLSSAGGRLGFFATGSSFDGNALTDTGWHVAVIRVSSTTAGGTVSATTTLQIDGGKQVLTTVSGAGTWLSMATANLLAVGGLPSNIAATAAHCDVGVVMTFSSSLTDAAAALAVSYCRQWAGLPIT